MNLSPTRPENLFLNDDEDDIEFVSHKAPPPQEVDIDAVFAGVVDDDHEMSFVPLPPRLNEEELKRQAEERHRGMAALTPHEILPSSSPEPGSGNPWKRNQSNLGDKPDDEKKARRRLVKLDENLLLGPNGFPRLIKMTKDFKIKGKGRESTDLNRLLQQYQFWIHQLYPKTQFRDTVERVEKLCHSRRMNVSLSVWRDEASGIQTKDPEDSDDNGDIDGNGSIQQSKDSASLATEVHNLRESLQNQASLSTDISSAHNNLMLTSETPDKDEALWRALEGGLSDPPPITSTAATSSVDDDQDMWDIINEVENAAEKSLTIRSIIPSIPEPAEDSDEDLYV